jgi:hypothetical protein
MAAFLLATALAKYAQAASTAFADDSALVKRTGDDDFKNICHDCTDAVGVLKAKLRESSHSLYFFSLLVTDTLPQRWTSMP